MHWDDPEGWDGEGGGREEQGTHVHPWLIHVNVGQKPPQYCKVISLQLKLKKRKNIDLGTVMGSLALQICYIKLILHKELVLRDKMY